MSEEEMDAVTSIGGSGDTMKAKIIDKLNDKLYNCQLKLTSEKITNTLQNIREYIAESNRNVCNTNEPPPLLESSENRKTFPRKRRILPRLYSNKKIIQPPWVFDPLPKVLLQGITSTEGFVALKYSTSSASESSENLPNTLRTLENEFYFQENCTENLFARHCAIERFDCFLNRTKKPPPRDSVNVFLQPEIAPEVMQAINDSCDRAYSVVSKLDDLEVQREDEEEDPLEPLTRILRAFAFDPNSPDKRDLRPHESENLQPQENQDFYFQNQIYQNWPYINYLSYPLSPFQHPGMPPQVFQYYGTVNKRRTKFTSTRGHIPTNWNNSFMKYSCLNYPSYYNYPGNYYWSRVAHPFNHGVGEDDQTCVDPDDPFAEDLFGPSNFQHALFNSVPYKQG